MIFIDTHVLLWLHGGKDKSLTNRAKDIINKNSLFISTLVELEIQILFEKKRIIPPAKKVIEHMANTIGLRIADSKYSDVTDAALALKWTRDPFDRLIVAEAMVHEAPLVTADRLIIENYKRAVW